jgi:predicted nucleic acid-binding protein
MNKIDKLFNTRYEYLLDCCYNSLKLIRRTDLNTTLLADAYIYIKENEIKLGDKIDEGLLESIVVNWCYKQVIWSNTSFKRKWIYKNKIDINTSVDLEENASETMDDRNKSIFKYINELTIDDEDLIESKMMDEYKISTIYSYINTLPLPEKLLFQYVFEDGIDNSGKLSRHIGISRTTCWKMIKKLKEDIRNHYEEQNKGDI